MQRDNLIEIDWNKIDSNVSTFLNFEIEKCKNHNIRLYIPKNAEVIFNGMHCSGYFDDFSMEFAVAYSRSQQHWLSTFVHESCHVDQWLEQTALWNIQINGQDPLELLDAWIARTITIEQSILNQVFDAVVEIELDCEKRSVEKIKEYGLPINISTYTKKSNAYVWSYRLVQQTCEWDHCCFHEYPNVWRKMPSHFNNNYNVLPENISKIFYNNLPL